MLAVMKHAKIMPWGIFSPAGLRAGVHRNTKVYMDASNMACMAPSSAMRGSACACGWGGGGHGARISACILSTLKPELTATLRLIPHTLTVEDGCKCHFRLVDHEALMHGVAIALAPGGKR